MSIRESTAAESLKQYQHKDSFIKIYFNAFLVLSASENSTVSFTRLHNGFRIFQNKTMCESITVYLLRVFPH